MGLSEVGSTLCGGTAGGMDLVGLGNEFCRTPLLGRISMGGGGGVCLFGGLGGCCGSCGGGCASTGDKSLVSGTARMPVPGTVLIISHLLKSLPHFVVRVFEKCDVQFFCFSISSRELNFRSGFSGFSGLSDFNRDTLCIRLGSILPMPFVMGACFLFGEGDLSCSDAISAKLSSLLVECDILILN